MEVLVGERSLVVEKERALVVVRVMLGIKVYKSWSWFMKLASMVLVLYSKVY